MGIGTGLAIAVPAATSVAGAAMGASAAGNAADAQSQATHDAAGVQRQNAVDALNFQKQVYQQQQANQQPWLQAGQGAVTNLQSLMPILAQPFTEKFQAPNSVTEQNDPGFQFRMQEGQKALERSAAARGGLLTGGTAKAVSNYAQDYATNEYGNVYNRALNEYRQRYDISQGNQNNAYNKYANLAGLGQTSASNLNSSAGQMASTTANTLMTSGAQIGQDLNNAGAARASGYVGSANAWGGAMSNLGQLPYLYQTMSNNAGMMSPYSAYGSGSAYSNLGNYYSSDPNYQGWV